MPTKLDWILLCHNWLCGHQLMAQSLFHMCINLVSLYSKYLTDCAQRNAFLETRRSMETRYKIEKENGKQERLLLSLLPRFVALEIIADIAKEDDNHHGKLLSAQFHKIYIHCYEDVRWDDDDDDISWRDSLYFSSHNHHDPDGHTVMTETLYYSHTPRAASFLPISVALHLLHHNVPHKNWLEYSMIYLLVSINWLRWEETSSSWCTAFPNIQRDHFLSCHTEISLTWNTFLF